jgi:N6-adenosine-specific RNA methylase IME4
MRERLWLVVSIALLASAGVLLWLAYTNAAFVAAALGVCAWFFDVRMNLKRRHDLVKLSGRNWVPRSELEEDEEERQ